MESTLTNRIEAKTSAITAPILTVVLQADRVGDISSRHRLDAIDEVQICRGAERSVRREGRTLTLHIPDPRMSSRHATLRRHGGRFAIEDHGSKNGTFVRGARVESPRTVESGDWIEVGRTFLVHRDAMLAVDDPLDAGPKAVAPMLATMLPELSSMFEVLVGVARSALPVLIRGETGSGKEAIARAVHDLSERHGAFVAVNCGALPANLVESELFGSRKGAFSGALADRPGLVRSSDGGTLFLDEIGDLAAPAQAALLRALQEREVLAVGATKPVPVDLRVVAATHRELDEISFRPDLLARLSGFVARVPPLRQRREDLGLLLRGILRRHAPSRTPELSHDAARALFAHSWPSNIRELNHVVARALVVSADAPLTLDIEPLELDDRALLSDEDRGRREDLVRLLREHDGNISAVARAMGKARVQIQRWMKRYRIER
jgi:transcriptional regulator of acetoin/glycerol metabolism